MSTDISYVKNNFPPKCNMCAQTVISQLTLVNGWITALLNYAKIDH